MSWLVKFLTGWKAAPSRVDEGEPTPLMEPRIKESWVAVVGYRMSEFRRTRPLLFLMGVVAAPSALALQAWEIIAAIRAALA